MRVFMIGMSTDKGGVEAYIQNLCGSVNEQDVEIVYHWPEMRINGKTWICPRNRHNYLKYWLFWTRFYRENKFDVVYLNTCDIVSIDPLKFAKAAGVPVRILHSHNTGNQQGIGKKMSDFHRWSEKQNRKHLYAYSTHLFACSKSAGDWMFGDRPYKIIKNGIHISKFAFSETTQRAIRERFGMGDGPVVGIIGRLDPQKNPLFTVRIAEAAIRKNENATFVFIGDGELRPEVQSAIETAGIGEQVKLVGAVDNVQEWMSAIDCILMPSLFEGLPFALVEAQAAGLPCVVSMAVSEEANITGLVAFIPLEEAPEVWAEKVLEACQKERKDVRQKLIDAGYSIEDTAKTVFQTIEKSLGKRT